MSEYHEIQRTLQLDIGGGHSAFLWGPRKTGKTTYLSQRFPTSRRYDLLETDLFVRLSKEPFRFREELIALHDSGSLHGPVIIDEVQKIPSLLDEVHWLIENKRLSFILCGSSARKLKRSHANLLGGRAWRFELHPLTTNELGGEFDLLKALNRGLIPSHYLDSEYGRSLKSYINDYLKEEIQQEGLVRSLPAFARFLDAAGFSHGELVNFTNVASECGVDAKTVAEYYRILVDTLIGTLLEPFHKRRKRKVISETTRFYLFDVGLAGALTKRSLQIDRGPEFGRAFEHLVLMELLAYRAYREKDCPIRFWRTHEGHEVDFVIDDAVVAIEVKGSPQVHSQELKGLKTFMDEYKPKKAFVVSMEPVPRKLSSGIEILPWKIFFERLWGGEIF